MIAAPIHLNVIPRPRQAELDGGFLTLEGGLSVSFPNAFAFEGGELAKILTRAVGNPPNGNGVKGKVSVVRFRHDEKDAGGFGPEGYRLTIDDHGIEIEAAAPAGAFYAVHTLRQMLPESSESGAPLGAISLPKLKLFDRPKFSWRGLLLDVSRHFFTVEEIKGVLDLLAFHKMNVFHWHLTDDGGWRLEIKRYPKLVEHGAWRTEKDFVWDYLDIEFPGPGSGKKVYGGFYSQDQIREIVRYAAERHIKIVPEIEMPGHSLAALSSYPELGCTVEAAKVFVKEVGMPYPNVYCAGKEETFEFLQNVLDEVIELFPSEYIHVGGDEVFRILWQNCDNCKKRVAEEGLKGDEELQSYFIRRIENYINAKGRKLIGWDEILDGGLAPHATVMSWRGTQGGIAAAKAGHDVVMTPYSHCYFDFDYEKTPTEHVLEFQPIPSELSEEEAMHVLGGQASLWTEYVPDIAAVQRMTLPRLASMAEVLWYGNPDREHFAARLDSYKERLRYLGVQQEESTGPGQNH